MIPAEFDYVAPGVARRGARRAADGGEDAKVLAGGHSLLPLMKLRLAAPALLVDLRRVPGLAGIERENGDWRIGAMTPHATLADEPSSGSRPRRRRTIADPQVRNRGTIGGSLAHGDPASDMPAVLLAAEGSVTVRGAGGERDGRGGRPVRGLPDDRGAARARSSPRCGCPALDGYGYGYQKFNRRQRTGRWWRSCALVRKAADGTCEDVRIGLTHMALDAAAGDGRGGGAARAAARRGHDRRGRRAGGGGHRARRPTSTRRRTTSATWRACCAGGRSRTRHHEPVRFATIDEVTAGLAGEGYLADRALAPPSSSPRRSSSRCCSRARRASARPRWRAALAAAAGARLIRLQCHEGIDLHHAVYDWDYPRQLLAIRAAEAGAQARELFGREFLLRRPLLEALEHDGPAVLLIDEIDRADDEFEAFLLEFLADFAVTIPELGTVTARARPLVVLTSNRTRELHDALKRRCLYHWIDYPSREREAEIVQRAAARRAGGDRRARLRRRRAAARGGALQAARAWGRRSPGRGRCSRSTPTRRSTRRSAWR